MKICKYIKGGSKKYILTEDYKSYIPFDVNIHIETPYCYLTANHFMEVYKGYEWDGASGPTIDTEDTMDGSLVHDVLYQLIREHHLPMKWRKEADKCIHKMCVEDGMPKWRAWYWYLALRWFGKGAAIAS
jgi:hypothetical protein